MEFRSLNSLITLPPPHISSLWTKNERESSARWLQSGLESAAQLQIVTTKYDIWQEDKCKIECWSGSGFYKMAVYGMEFSAFEQAGHNRLQTTSPELRKEILAIVQRKYLSVSWLKKLPLVADEPKSTTGTPPTISSYIKYHQLAPNQNTLKVILKSRQTPKDGVTGIVWSCVCGSQYPPD